MLATVGVNSFGVLFSPRLLELGSSLSLLSSVASSSLGAGCVLCLFMAPLLHRWGCRRLVMPIALLYSVAFFLAALASSWLEAFAGAAMIAGEWMGLQRGVAGPRDGQGRWALTSRSLQGRVAGSSARWCRWP